MKKLMLLSMVVLAMIVSACGGGDSNANVNSNVSNVVATNSCANVTQELEQVKKEAVEKDKKIVWLRQKAKEAGANLNGNTNAK